MTDLGPLNEYPNIPLWEQEIKNMVADPTATRRAVSLVLLNNGVDEPKRKPLAGCKNWKGKNEDVCTFCFWQDADTLSCLA